MSPVWRIKGNVVKGFGRGGGRGGAGRAGFTELCPRLSGVALRRVWLAGKGGWAGGAGPTAWALRLAGGRAGGQSEEQ